MLHLFLLKINKYGLQNDIKQNKTSIWRKGGLIKSLKKISREILALFRQYIQYTKIH